MKRIDNYNQIYKRMLQIIVGVVVLSTLVIVTCIIYLGVTSHDVYSLSFDWDIDSEENEDLYVQVSKDDFWVTEKGIAMGFEAELVNKTKYTIYDWEVEIKTPIKTSFNSSWNGEWVVNSGIATFTPSELIKSVPRMTSKTFGGVLCSRDNLNLNEVSITYKRTIPIYEIPLFWVFLTIVIVFTLAGVILSVSFQQVKNYKKTHASYKDLVTESLRTIANIIDTKDEYTRGHSVRVAFYARMIAERMGMSEHDQERLFYIGMLHDIGKIGIPSSILTKPGRLDDEEYEVIKRHTRLGASIIKDFHSIDGAIDGIRYHHERYDGKGYNEGLKGEEIPLEGRIICVADAYDAMSSARCYRKTLSYDYILQQLKDNAGKQFDPEIVKYMIAMVEEGYAPISEAEMEYSQNERKKHR